MIHTFSHILSSIEQRIFFPVYFLSGEENYYTDTLSNLLSENVLNETEKTFNLTILYGKETSISVIKDYCIRFPMMAEYSVTIVREAQELKKGFDELIPYFENPNPSNILVICYKHNKVDGRSKLNKFLKDNKNVSYLESSRVKSDSVPNWIEQYLKKKGFVITKKALTLIVEYMDNDLSRIANELDKLVLIQNESRQIDLNEIEKHIGISKTYNNFELQKALTYRDIEKLTKIVNYFDINPKSLIFNLLIGTLFSHFSKACVLEYSKKDKKITASELNLGWHLDEYIQTIKSYKGKLIDVIAIIEEYDLKSKGINSNNSDHSELLKEMIFKIVSL